MQNTLKNNLLIQIRKGGVAKILQRHLFMRISHKMIIHIFGGFIYKLKAIKYDWDNKLTGGFMAVNAINIAIRDNLEIVPQNNQSISESITQNWTEQAIECYKLDCDCSQCSIAKGNYSFVCQMPKVLDILIKTLGEPSTTKLERIK